MSADQWALLGTAAFLFSIAGALLLLRHELRRSRR